MHSLFFFCLVEKRFDAERVIDRLVPFFFCVSFLDMDGGG